jgi:hypothetical protein
MALLFLFATLAIAAIGTPGISYTTLVAFVSLRRVLHARLAVRQQCRCRLALSSGVPITWRRLGVGYRPRRFDCRAAGGGMLIARQLPPRELFLMASLPMVVGMVAAALVAGSATRISAAQSSTKFAKNELTSALKEALAVDDAVSISVRHDPCAPKTPLVISGHGEACLAGCGHSPDSSSALISGDRIMKNRLNNKLRTAMLIAATGLTAAYSANSSAADVFSRTRTRASFFPTRERRSPSSPLPSRPERGS